MDQGGKQRRHTREVPTWFLLAGLVGGIVGVLALFGGQLVSAFVTTAGG